MLVIRMKTVIILTLTGVLAGIVVAAWIVPPALSWYTGPVQRAHARVGVHHPTLSGI
jgi:hypothetical protein